MAEKPLSPHIQIYRWEITMLVSILHRVTGIAMAVGTAFVVWMLLALASGQDAFYAFHDIATSLVGRLALIGWTFAIFLHMANGVRHFFWDVGKGYQIPTARRTALLAILFAALMTALIWWSVCCTAQGSN